jgi:hypothetical protein
VYALYIGPVVARQHACAAGRKKLRCSEGAGFGLTVTLAVLDCHSMHCPGIGSSDSQIDRGRRMTVNATFRSCAR